MARNSKDSKDSHKKRGGREKMFTAQQIIDALESAHGIQASAARNLQTSRATVARYIKENPDIAAAYEQVNESTIDFAESKLFQAMNDGNITAIIFFLKTKAKQRGYIETQKIEGAGENGEHLIRIIKHDDGSA